MPDLPPTEPTPAPAETDRVVDAEYPYTEGRTAPTHQAMRQCASCDAKTWHGVHECWFSDRTRIVLSWICSVCDTTQPDKMGLELLGEQRPAA